MNSLHNRRDVWNDELMHPSSLGTRFAFEATGANMQLFNGWLDLVNGDPALGREADWIGYVQWLEGEIGITTDRDDHEYETAGDMHEHYKYVSELWAELDKLKPPPYNHMGVTRDEHERYCLMMRTNDTKRLEELRNLSPGDMTPDQLRSLAAAKDRLAIANRVSPQESSEPQFDAKGRTVVRIPGDVLAIVNVEGFDTEITKVVFSPHASSAGYFGPSAEFWDFPEGVSQEQVDQHLDIQSTDGRFWRAMQEHLPTHDVKWEE